MQETDDSWTLADDDFRSFLESVSIANGHIWSDRPGIDPAMEALVVERQLRRAGLRLAGLDKLFPDRRGQLAIAAQQCRFVAGLLDDGACTTFYARCWLTAARRQINEVAKELTE